LVEQRTLRYANLLWEFWKRDSELFPKDIICDASLETRPHILLFVFDGSIDKVPDGEEEVTFYRNILQRARSKSSDLIYESNMFRLLLSTNCLDQSGSS
jgi:hypothetical protein